MDEDIPTARDPERNPHHINTEIINSVLSKMQISKIYLEEAIKELEKYGGK